MTVTTAIPEWEGVPDPLDDEIPLPEEEFSPGDGMPPAPPEPEPAAAVSEPAELPERLSYRELLDLAGPQYFNGTTPSDETIARRLALFGQLVWRLSSAVEREWAQQLWVKYLEPFKAWISEPWRVVQVAIEAGRPATLEGAASGALSTVQLFAGDPPRPQAMHIERRLIDRDINITAGHGGSGKSVEALTVAVCVATGRPLYGSLQVHRPGPVLLVVPEDGQSGARMIVDAIAAGLELDVGERDLLAERLHVVADDVAVTITNDAPRIADSAIRLGAVLVVLDPKINLLGGAPDNDNDVASRTCDDIRREICRRAGATVLMTDHLRKPGRDGAVDATPTAHDARGGGAWVNASRLAFSLTRRGDHRTLTAIKANRVQAEIRHELELRIEADPANPAHWATCRLTDANAGSLSEALTPAKGRSLNGNEQTVLRCLDDRHEPGRRLSFSRWRDESGLNPNTFKSVRERLLDAGLACAIPTGKKTRTGAPEYAYEISSDGRSALETGWAKGEGVSER